MDLSIRNMALTWCGSSNFASSNPAILKLLVVRKFASFDSLMYKIKIKISGAGF